MWVIAVVGAANGEAKNNAERKRPTSDPPGFPFQRIDCGPASSYAARSHAATRPRAGLWDLRQVAAAHHIERARMSIPLAAVRLSIANDGSSSTVDPSVDTSSPLRRHWSLMASA